LAELSIFAPGSPDAWIDGVMDLALHDATSSELWIVDWKTNRRRAAETEQQFFARLLAEYEPQLRAYGRSAALFFPGHAIRLWLYSSSAGAWVEIVS
jgi:ATP-dependent exoDNAse (exonuclease V) beta subunit